MNDYIYKYRPLYKTEEDKRIALVEHTINLIQDGEIYLSDPKLFNDPFDSIIDVIAEGTREEMREYLKRLLLSESEIAEKMKTKSFPNLCREAVERVHKLDFLKVCCFASFWNNVLMWSHYANSHTGVCIGIRTHKVSESPNLRFRADQLPRIKEGIDNRFWPALSVKYNREKPKQLNLLRDDFNDMLRFVLNKYCIWKYEEEIRIAFPNPWVKNNPIFLASSQIGEVIFGLRTPDYVIRMVLDRISPKKGIKYYKIINKSEYILEREPIDPTYSL